MLLSNFDRKEHLQHRAVSLRQHGFLVSVTAAFLQSHAWCMLINYKILLIYLFQQRWRRHVYSITMLCCAILSGRSYILQLHLPDFQQPVRMLPPQPTVGHVPASEWYVYIDNATVCVFRLIPGSGRLCGLADVWCAAIYVSAHWISSKYSSQSTHTVSRDRSGPYSKFTTNDKKYEFWITLICLQSRLAAHPTLPWHETHISSRLCRCSLCG